MERRDMEQVDITNNRTDRPVTALRTAIITGGNTGHSNRCALQFLQDKPRHRHSRHPVLVQEKSETALLTDPVVKVNNPNANTVIYNPALAS